MTQPAKVQEPSMEEILASIRRIIADDEAKPPVAEKPASPAPPAKPVAAAPAAKPAAKPAVMTDIPPSALPAAKAAAAKPAAPAAKPAPPPAAPAAAPAVSNSQDDIDALLNGLDEVTVPEEIRAPLPDGDVFDLTDDMAVAMAAPPPPPPQPSFQKVEPQDDLEFTESTARASLRQPAFEPRPFESPARAGPADSVALDRVRRRIRFQLARQHRAEQQCADAGRPRQGNAAADAEVLARRQSARPRRAHRQGGNRTGFTRRQGLTRSRQGNSPAVGR